MPTDSSAEDRLTQRVDELLSEMTPAEKAGQLTQYFYFRLPPQADTEPALGVDLDAQPRAVEEALARGEAGSLLFVTDPAESPFNVIEPGKRPRVTLTPTLAMKDGQPWMAFSVQGGDSQDQNLLQYLLNVVEFGMTPQRAVEAPNMNSFQMRNSFQDHSPQPGRMLLASSYPAALRAELQRMGYTLQFSERTSGPITAIWFDRVHGTMWGAASNHGEDYGIAW